LLKIGDSLPAPRLYVVEKPNDWAKTMKTVDALTEAQKLQFEFWQAFANYAFDKPEFISQFSRRKASPRRYYGLSVGSSEYHINLTISIQKKRLGVEIYINNNEELFAKLADQKDTVEQFLNMSVDWKKAGKACLIITFADRKDITKNQDTWDSIFDWYIETAIKFKEMIKKFDV